MNISSVIVLTRDSNNQDIIERLKSIPGCDVPISEGVKLILTIEAEDIATETAAMKKIEETPGVVSAKLVYAYSEHELAKELEKVEQSADYPEWLNDDHANAKDIPYSGRLKM